MPRNVIVVLTLGLSVLILATASLNNVAVAQKGSGKGLPQYWKALGLTETQREKVYKVQTDYRSKIKALTDQIKQLREEEQRELLKILTDDQRKALREIYRKKAEGADIAPTKDEKKSKVEEKK